MGDKIKIPPPIAANQGLKCPIPPPWFVQKSEYRPLNGTFEFLINGERAFGEVHRAIAAAKKSVCIICWGFQPSMYFIRDGKAPCIGELLMSKAKEGVRVRILGWEYPFNSAGAAGEANLPGKGGFRIRDRAGQTATETQYAFDRKWFFECSAKDNQAANWIKPCPVFVSRGFDTLQRTEIAYQAALHSLDPDLSLSTLGSLAGAATHHQKSVLVDYEVPERAVGFVMGHNMLDEYWDTDAHTALNRGVYDRLAPNRGPTGSLPRQDISSRITGPILAHLHHNFASAWRRETGEDLFVARNAQAVAQQLPLGQEDEPVMAQLLRTQAQEGKRDIEKLYLQAVNNATQFIYIENQYFRWPPLADAILAAAEAQTRAGRDPGEHGALHLFVITNVIDDGIGKGTVNTQRMLERLGRADTIPEVTKQMLIDEAKQAAPPKPRPDGPKDFYGKWQLAEWEARYGEEIKAIEQSTVHSQDIPGLKVHVCSLVAPDSPPGKPWMPVYIVSKLMIVNDVFTTHGSANINTRSMQVDSKLNIAHERASVTQAMRRRLWELHTAGEGAQDEPKKAFKAWEKIIQKNKDRRDSKDVPMLPYAPLVEFYYDKDTLENKD